MPDGAIDRTALPIRRTLGIGEKVDDVLPPGSAGIIAIYEQGDADAVAGALVNSIRSSIAQVDKASAGLGG